jgi:hypothetical protein
MGIMAKSSNGQRWFLLTSLLLFWLLKSKADEATLLPGVILDLQRNQHVLSKYDFVVV